MVQQIKADANACVLTLRDLMLEAGIDIGENIKGIELKETIELGVEMFLSEVEAIHTLGELQTHIKEFATKMITTLMRLNKKLKRVVKNQN